jgi:molecular chaperone GrpE
MFKKWTKMSKQETNEDEIIRDEENVNEQENTEQTEEAIQDAPTEELSDLEKKEIEYKELHDKYIRLFSEFDNFRKRTAKEKLELSMNAGGDVMKQIIPTLDDFDRAISNNENVEDINIVKEGFSLIHHKLTQTLTAKGLKAMDSLGEEFDVNKHEALTQIPAPSDDLKGKVVDVIEKGYLLNDKVLRFAKVVVGQ